MSTLRALSKGDKLEEVQLSPVSRLDLIKYAAASGDFNPIHTIDEEAEKAGLPGIIAHGMWTMGNLAQLFTSYYEEGFIKRYKIRFSCMVFLSDELTLQAKIKERTLDLMTLEVRAVNQKDNAVIKGIVEFALY